MTTDSIADLLARLQNAIMRRKGETIIPITKMNAEILEILKNEKMIGGFEQVDGAFAVTLLYREDAEPVVEKFTKISKSGQRRYVSAKEIVPVMNGRGISIISTSAGVMTGAMAKSKGIGGELICEVW